MADITITTSKSTRKWVPEAVFRAQKRDAYKSYGERYNLYRELFEAERDAAQERFIAGYRRQRLAHGLPWRDAKLWHEGRAVARKKAKAEWKKICDVELYKRIEDCVYGRNDAPKISPTTYAILKAELKLATDSAMLYASIDTIAKQAHVCRGSVVKVNRQLEEFGVLRRQCSGGRRQVNGQTTYRTNIYYVCHQRLREILGIECLYESRFAIPHGNKRNSLAALALRATIQATTLFGSIRAGHPFFSRSGYARNLGNYRPSRYRDLISIYVCAGPGREWTVYNAKTNKTLKPKTTHKIPLWKTQPKPPENPLSETDIAIMKTLSPAIQRRLAQIGASNAHSLLLEYSQWENPYCTKDQYLETCLQAFLV